MSEKSQTVVRYDFAETGKASRLDNGFLKVPASVGKTGLLKYRQLDGSTRVELRRPEEVFHLDSLETLKMVPVTMDHPKDGFVTSFNAKEYTIGHGGENPIPNKELIDLNLMIMDEDAIEDISSGKVQVSPGYTVKLVNKPGIWNGQRYDAEQTEIRYNHLAIVERGRAGDSVRLHLDSDAIEVTNYPVIDELIDDNNTQELKPMTTIKLDGVDFEVTEQVQQAFTATLEKAAAEKKVLSEDKQQLSAKFDALQIELDSAKEELSLAKDPARVQEAVNARLNLERQASKVLGSDTRFDELSDSDILKQVAIKTYPELEAKMDSAEAAYLQGLFDSAVAKAEALAEDEDDLVSARADAEGAKDVTVTSAEARRIALINRNKSSFVTHKGSK